MITLSELMDLDLLHAMIQGGYISCKHHVDDHNLTIYNYTHKTQWDRVWNEATLLCRGLITYNEPGVGEVIKSRALKKFFGVEMVDEFPPGPFYATDKADGCLGIAYMAPDGAVAIATRGSFVSEMAAWATKWIRRQENSHLYTDICNHLNQYQTPLFEIIYPGSQIVIDYKGWETLIGITAIDNNTGLDVPLNWSGDRVTRYDQSDMDSLMEIPQEGREGFVLTWEDGTRLKIKYDEYKRLHRILTGLSEKRVWEMLMAGQDTSAIAMNVPDEFYRWLGEVTGDLQAQYSQIESESREYLATLDLSIPRKDLVPVVKQFKYWHIVFRMMDEWEYSEQIWKLVKPKGNRVFALDEG